MLDLAERCRLVADRKATPVQVFQVAACWLSLHGLAPAQARYLDARRESGKLVKGWNLIVPEWVLTRSWDEVG